MVGLWLDSVILEIFSNNNDAVIDVNKGCITLQPKILSVVFNWIVVGFYIYQVFPW